jgi:hypothetical protein
MSDEQKTKILICDDHPIMRFGIAAIIQSQPNMMVAAQAGTAEEAIQSVGPMVPQHLRSWTEGSTKISSFSASSKVVP